ncbi:hypothetical protein DER45DRAFT_627171 [Fusarium avenaceum]|nr:hypothetical protein DER45DRAFT_627171 [Fusarium avenaceum]
MRSHSSGAEIFKRGPDTLAFSNPFPQLHDNADLLLGYDFFTGRRACGDRVNHVDTTSPKYVPAHLANLGARPALFCIIGDLTICGGYTYTGLKNWNWTGTQESLVLDRKGSDGKDIDPDMNSPHGVEQEAGFLDLPDHPMLGVILRVETTNANVSHYLEGDLGEGIEQMVLKWSTVSDETNSNQRKPTKCPAMKTSHHGAKKSTPMELLYAFDSEYIVVSNGVRADWNHLKPKILLALEALKNWKVKRALQVAGDGMQMDHVLDFKALNYHPYLTYDTNGEGLAVDPGYIVPIWDNGFQAETLKIYSDNNSFIREVAKYKTNDKPSVHALNEALVLHLIQNWRFVSSFEAQCYAGNFVSWGTFLDELANQEQRAVLITQTVQGGGDETIEDT